VQQTQADTAYDEFEAGAASRSGVPTPLKLDYDSLDNGEAAYLLGDSEGSYFLDPSESATASDKPGKRTSRPRTHSRQRRAQRPWSNHSRMPQRCHHQLRLLSPPPCTSRPKLPQLRPQGRLLSNLQQLRRRQRQAHLRIPPKSYVMTKCRALKA
jgi:hypothetical protein